MLFFHSDTDLANEYNPLHPLGYGEVLAHSIPGIIFEKVTPKAVDAHVWRISIRLGLIGKKVTAEAAHDLLQALLPNDARTINNFHKALLRHGQRICVFERPHCEKCPITDLCDYYNTVVKQKSSTL
jgi:endonuclease III